MSKFNFLDRVKVTESCERKYLHGKTCVIEYVDKNDPECTYGAMVDGTAMWFCELDLQPHIAPTVITVYAVCDKKGQPIYISKSDEEGTLEEFLVYNDFDALPSTYSIRPFALTPINE